MSYVTGFLTPVKIKDKDRYIKSAEIEVPEKYLKISSGLSKKP